MPFAATWMDLEVVTLSEVKSEREKQISYDITYVESKKNLTDLENELMVTRGEGLGGGIDWEFGIDMYTLLYLK